MSNKFKLSSTVNPCNLSHITVYFRILCTYIRTVQLNSKLALECRDSRANTDFFGVKRASKRVSKSLVTHVYEPMYMPT